MLRRLIFVCKNQPCTEPELDARYTYRLWRPSWRRLVPPGLPRRRFVAWLQHYLHIYRNRDYSVLYIMDRQVIVHRSCVLPANFRIPYMQPEDVEILMTFTHEAYRNQGLAQAGLRRVLTLMRKPGRQFWYVVREDNLPSIAVCKKMGFSLVGYQKIVQPHRLSVKRFAIENPE
jgi:RimJ/RimL family protein N-acetyltransferase